VEQLGANAHGEILEAGRVPDCYLGLLLNPADHDECAGVLVVAPAALLRPCVPQPDGTVLYELLTGHPDRAAHELLFLPDLTVELCVPGPTAPGPGSGSSRRRPPVGSSPPGAAATSGASKSAG
jgi:hypothetical protein